MAHPAHFMDAGRAPLGALLASGACVVQGMPGLALIMPVRDLEQIDFQSRWVPPWVSFGSLVARGAGAGSRIWPSSPSREAAGLGMLLQRGCQKVYSP